MYSQNAIMSHFSSYPYVSLSNVDANLHIDETLSLLESYYTQTQAPINEPANLSLADFLTHESNFSTSSFNALLDPTLLYPFISLPPIMSTPSQTPSARTNSSLTEPQNPTPKIPSNKTHSNGAIEIAFQVDISTQPTKTSSTVPSTPAGVLGTFSANEKEMAASTKSDKPKGYYSPSEPHSPSMADIATPTEKAKLSTFKRSISYPNERANLFPVSLSKSKLSPDIESKSVSPTPSHSLQESRKHSIHSRRVPSKLENDENRCSNSKTHISPSCLYQTPVRSSSAISTHNLRITPARTITPSATHKHPTSGSKLASFPPTTKTKLTSRFEVCEDSPPKDKSKIEIVSKPDEMWHPSEPGEKPPYSYATLIAQAILSAQGRSRNLSSIYDWIVESYSFFDKADNGWKNSIRHNLSLNKDFVKTDVKVDGEKGCRWTIAENRISHWLEVQWRHSQSGGVNKAIENSASKNKSKNRSNLDDNSDSDDDLRDKSKSGKTKKKATGLEQAMTLYRPEDFARLDFGKGGVRGTRRFTSSPLREMSSASARTPPPLPYHQRVGNRALLGMKRRNHDSHEGWCDDDKENLDPQSKKRRPTLCRHGVFSDESDQDLSAEEFSSDDEQLAGTQSRTLTKPEPDSYFSPKEWLKSDASILMSSPAADSLPPLTFTSSYADSLPNSQEPIINPYWTTEQAEHLLDSDPNLFSSPIRNASSHLVSFKDPTLIGSSPLVKFNTGSAAFNRLSSPGYDLGFETTPEDCRYHSSLRNGLSHPEFYDVSFGVDPDKLDFTGIRGEQFGIQTPEKKLLASPIKSIVMGSPMMLKSPLRRVNTWGI